MPRRTLLLSVALCVIGALLTIYSMELIQEAEASSTFAHPAILFQNGGDEGEEEPPPPTTAYCLLCHTQPDQTWTLPSGEVLSVTIDPEVLANSVHGDSNPEGPLECSDCHDAARFPHVKPLAQNEREFVLERYASCRNCHEDQYLHAQDSVHGEALRAGELEVAVCIDCHGSHDIQSPNEPRERISLTCGKCHGAVFEEYRMSIHGSALLEGNPDVPTCIDCHGVHNIPNPTTTAFRVRSPELCANCHADEDLMDKYGISTDVFDSYLSDFHGTTVTFFEQEDPEQPTNKAVCYDCHGVHNIQKPDKEHIRENLLPTCQQCHPNADENFPDAWTGHYPPTLDSNPLLVISDTLYSYLTPLSVAGLLLLVATDILRRLWRR
jgi:predicted CXXCH cytochrome family protein